MYGFKWNDDANDFRFICFFNRSNVFRGHWWDDDDSTPITEAKEVRLFKAHINLLASMQKFLYMHTCLQILFKQQQKNMCSNTKNSFWKNFSISFFHLFLLFQIFWNWCENWENCIHPSWPKFHPRICAHTKMKQEKKRRKKKRLMMSKRRRREMMMENVWVCGARSLVK